MMLEKSESLSGDHRVSRFLSLIQESRRGKLKIYLGMAPGVGKTFRMLTEAHTLIKKGFDVYIGYIRPLR